MVKKVNEGGSESTAPFPVEKTPAEIKALEINQLKSCIPHNTADGLTPLKGRVSATPPPGTNSPRMPH